VSTDVSPCPTSHICNNLLTYTLTWERLRAHIFIMQQVYCAVQEIGCKAMNELTFAAMFVFLCMDYELCTHNSTLMLQQTPCSMTQ
jgi:hypothetical protein